MNLLFYLSRSINWHLSIHELLKSLCTVETCYFGLIFYLFLIKFKQPFPLLNSIYVILRYLINKLYLLYFFMYVLNVLKANKLGFLMI